MIVSMKQMINVIEATIIIEKFKGEDGLIPSTPMILKDMPFQFKRVKFSVCFALAITINKSRGQPSVNILKN